MVMKAFAECRVNSFWVQQDNSELSAFNILAKKIKSVINYGTTTAEPNTT